MAEPYDAYKMYFKSKVDGQGWSETYYTSHLTDPVEVRAKLLLLRSARAACLSEQFIINYAEASQVDVAGDVIVAICEGFTGLLDEAALPTNTSIYVRMFADDNRSGVRLFRGLPLELLNTDGSVNPLSAAWGAIDDFAEYLNTLLNDYGILNLDVTARFPKFTFSRYTDHCVGAVASRQSGKPFGLRRGRSN